MEPILVSTCGNEQYEVRPMSFEPQNIQRVWDQAKQYKTLFGKQLTSPQDLLNQFAVPNGLGGYDATGLFWVINDFTGIFYLTEIQPAVDALAHYTFFDRRHHGRKKLLRDMLKYLFERYKFRRISAEIPLYARPQAKHFITDCGFSLEGKKRKAAWYNDDWFDVNQFGILREEVMDGRK